MTTVRIPQSLFWLLKNRRLVAGRIAQANDQVERLTKKLQDAQRIIDRYDELKKQIVVLTADLAGLDRSIGLHEIPIDVTKLAYYRPHANPTNFKYGEVTKLIYMALSKSPTKWLSTTEIAIISVQYSSPHSALENFPQYRHAFKDRLKCLAGQGKIDRVISGLRSEEGYWRLKPVDRQGITYSGALSSSEFPENNLESNQTVPLDQLP